MKSGKFKIVILAVWVLCALVLFMNFWARNESTSAQTVGKQVKEIEGYKNWTKVNSTPQLMPQPVAESCALWISQKGVIIDGDDNPHRDKYFTVYVNEIGRAAMLEQKNPKFPAGSVIVKEKLPNEKSQKPELLTVMIKQKKGFNPETGDWEFMVVDGTGTKVEGRGNLQNCQSCHVAYQKSDYIFRTYLDEKTEGKLK
jgi:hypothetical protein